jgi:beta-galactosidase GanA
VRIAMLWFGTWKNGGMDYTPPWVKTDPKTYPRVIDQDGHAVDAISPISQAGAEADGKALAAVMQHLKETDSDRHTVILVQVENEAGTLGSDRDYSPAANELFTAAVPEIVLGSLHKEPGTWQKVFGAYAAEAFASYYTAHYINQVAAAGKAVYPLPIYVNVWPREQSGLLRPGYSSPSGGAVSWLLDMWKAVATSIDIIGPDNYDSNAQLFLNIAHLYTRADNPLLVPETGTTVAHARHMFYVFATPGALGISMFGINPVGMGPVAPVASGTAEMRRRDSDEVAINYKLIEPCIPALLAARDAGHLKAAVEEDGVNNGELTFDSFDAVARFGPVRPSYSGEKGTGNPDLSGRVLVAQLAQDEFLVVGCNANVVFSPKLGDPEKHTSFLSVEEGSYQNGNWHKSRLWNGDQTYFGLALPHDGQTLRVKLMKY